MILRRLALTAFLLLPFCALPQGNDSLLKPFVMDYRRDVRPAVDLSFLNDAPAGKNGFIRIQNGHFVKPGGSRIRFWGVHLTDWSPGSILLPPKKDIPMWAGALAHFGVNCVRLHFLDLDAPRGIIDGSDNDTRSFDAAQLDRLDFLISELKKRGIYVDLNLNVGRSFKAGDGVVDFDRIRWGKGLIIFDARLIELQKEYAQKLLTHVNAYTGLEYRKDPVVAIVEIANENGIGIGFRAPTAYYDEELTRLYNSWLERNCNPEELKKIREAAGVSAASPVPRLKFSEIASAPDERYRAEVEFYMDLESRFFEGMSGFLKNTLHVQSPIIGTADHSHTSSSYPILSVLSKLDVLDGHVYWEHPEAPPPRDTPMVNDPLHSTVVQLSRTAFADKPYTVSETNNPFPNPYASEGIPIIAAYGDFQDWDAIITYTFEPKLAPDWKPYIGDSFDISLDPVKMTEFAAGALLFRRQDVSPARKTIERTYSKQQVVDSERLPRSDAPYFTPGFPLALPLEDEVRIRSLDGPPTGSFPPAGDLNDIASDTGQLHWYHGLVTVDAERAQALIGFVKSNPKVLTNLSADLTNDFASVVLVSTDSKPISEASEMLLTTGSRVTNSHGGSPTLIDTVKGSITLRNLEGATAVSAAALDGAGCRIGNPISASKNKNGWVLPVGNPVTTWYLVSVKR